MTLRIAPIGLTQANEYVERFHRHNGRLPSAKFAVAACDTSGAVLGVAVAGIPKARMLVDGGTLEVNRVCSDGSRNVCSLLYGACVRAGKALGYWKAITYTLETEAGASLRASGWTLAASNIGGGKWARANQQTRRGLNDSHDLGAKNRWEIEWAEPLTLIWPEVLHDGQEQLFGGAP